MFSFLLKLRWPWQYMVNIFSTRFMIFKWKGCLKQLMKSLTAVNITQRSSPFSEYGNNDSGWERPVDPMGPNSPGKTGLAWSCTVGGGFRICLQISFSFTLRLCDTALVKREVMWPITVLLNCNPSAITSAFQRPFPGKKVSLVTVSQPALPHLI